MDEEGGGLRNRYDEKVYNISLCNSWFMEIDSNRYYRSPGMT
jgi:hypothetical protein